MQSGGRACAAGQGRVAAIYIETPANPTNGLVDIAAARTAVGGARRRRRQAAAGDRRQHACWARSTRTPLAARRRPRRHVADEICRRPFRPDRRRRVGAKAMLAPVRRMRSTLGTMCDPHTAWLLMRSLETLKLRMEAGARRRAQGRRVPARPSEDRERLVSRFPARRTIPTGRCTSGRTRAPARPSRSRSKAARRGPSRCSTGCEVIKLAVSLGGTETLASHPGVDDALGDGARASSRASRSRRR